MDLDLVNDGNNAAVAAGQRDRRLQQGLPGEFGLGPRTVAVGAITCITAWPALYAAASQEPPVYSPALIGAFLGGVAAMWAGNWATVFGGHRRHNISFIIFCVSFVPLAIAAAYGASLTPSF